jgi:hypothetical protein
MPRWMEDCHLNRFLVPNGAQFFNLWIDRRIMLTCNAQAHSKFASEICDNCWALVNPLNPTVQLQPDNVKLQACKGCRVVYYCDKVQIVHWKSTSLRDRQANFSFLFQKCQQAAWRHHHKLECACLRALNLETFVKEGSILDIANIRSLVRLLLFQRNREQRSRVSGELEAREYEVLQTNRKEREKDEAFKEAMEEICGVLAEYTHFNLEGAKEYFCAVSPLVASTKCNTRFPILSY